MLFGWKGGAMLLCGDTIKTIQQAEMLGIALSERLALRSALTGRKRII